jgi:ACS family allantoate permease-like MFS transporter
MAEKHAVPLDAEKAIPATPLADAIRNGSLDKNILQHTDDGDEALKAFMSHQGEVIELDEATNKRLLRKIDWNLMPVCIFIDMSTRDAEGDQLLIFGILSSTLSVQVMCIVYGLNYLDKTTLSYASVMGLRTDIGIRFCILSYMPPKLIFATGLHGTNYSWLSSM